MILPFLVARPGALLLLLVLFTQFPSPTFLLTVEVLGSHMPASRAFNTASRVKPCICRSGLFVQQVLLPTKPSPWLILIFKLKAATGVKS